MAGLLLGALAVAALALGALGCRDERTPLPAACTESPAAIERALERVPAAVALDDGSRLSDCVRLAYTDAELQAAGLVLVEAAERLVERARATADATSALRLGYLAGAARRGAAMTQGIQVELARRIERTASRLTDGPAGVRDAMRRGLAAGQARG